MAERVLFFSPHAGIWQHAFPEALIADAIGQSGADVFYVTCGGVLSSFCVVMASRGLRIESAAADIRSIRMETVQRINKVFDDSYASVSAILTPEQRVKFDQMQRERREMMQRHWQEAHRRPGGPGPEPSAP